MLSYSVEDIEAWADACTSPDTLRQLHHTASARAEDLQATDGQGAEHLERPHVLTGGGDSTEKLPVPPTPSTPGPNAPQRQPLARPPAAPLGRPLS